MRDTVTEDDLGADDPVAGDQAPWRRGLNPEQLRAVTHRGGPLLVVAGAGSGKTRTLAARVADLVAEGVAPERILLLTFTRRAAREMLERVVSSTGDRSAGRVQGGTFHSAANLLLRGYGRAVGLSPGFTVLDQGDATDLLGLVRAELGLAESRVRFPRKDTVANIYGRTVNAQLPLSETLDRWFPWCREHVEPLRDLFSTYVQRKRQHQVLDYDDLLLYWRALLGSDAGPTVQGLFDHVLVDEYQDTNAVQADILAGHARTAGVTAVGDDAQAIYSFRAASVANIEGFPDRFPGTTLVTLERNYRSTPPILEAANAIIAASPRGYPKRLWSDRPAGPRPTLVTCADEGAQSAHVCDAILEQREHGVPLTQQAVLFRTGHHSDALELELARRDIPYVKFGGLRFLEAAHVKDLLSLLRVLDNPRDVLAWTRVLGALEGVGPATTAAMLAALGLASDLDGVAADGALFRFLHEPLDVPTRARDDVELLRAALADCAAGGTTAQPPPSQQIDRLRAFCEVSFRRRYDDADARLADLEQLAALAGQYPDRSRFLTELTLDPPNATGDLAGPPHLDDDWLTLSTIHSAKGAEWKAVYVIHAADGNIPSDMATGDPETVEEERRLLYVAVTRAKDALQVTFPLRYYHRRFGLDDAHNYAQPSRFLDPARDRFEHRTADSWGPVDDDAPRVAAGGDPVDGLLSELFAG